MQLQIELLKTFISVAESMSFTKSAKILNKTQSAVSMQMKRLEEETGKILFTKSGRSFVMTEAGERLLMHALRIIKVHDEACDDMQEPELDGIVRLGAPSDYAEGIIPDILKKFYDRFPSVRVDTICDTSHKLRKRLENDRIDMAILSGHEDGTLIYTEPMVWIAAKDFKINMDEPIPLAVYPDSCVCRRASFSELTSNNIKYRIAYESENSSIIKAAVRSGTAIAPVIARICTDEFKILDETSGIPQLPNTTVSLHKNPNRDNELTRALEKFILQTFEAEKRESF